MEKKFYYLLMSFTLWIGLSCNNVGVDYSKLKSNDIRLFKHVAWDLAKAVETEDTNKIDRIIKKGKIKIDVREPKFGQTLLIWAIENDKYLSSKKLLELNADPNIFTKVTPISAIICSALKYETSKYLKLTLKHGGNPNNYTNLDTIVFYQTPLIAASRTRLESVKLLIENGADINFVVNDYSCALFDAKFGEISPFHSVFDKRSYTLNFRLMNQ